MPTNAQSPGQSQDQNAGRCTNYPFTPTQINLPKGGGAIRGISEKSIANAVTDTGLLAVPIARRHRRNRTSTS